MVGGDKAHCAAALWRPAAQLRRVARRALDAVGDARPLADQSLPLPTGASGVLLGQAGDRHHRAVATLAAQPAQEDAQQHCRIEAVGLGALPLATYPSVAPDAADDYQFRHRRSAQPVIG